MGKIKFNSMKSKNLSLFLFFIFTIQRIIYRLLLLHLGFFLVVSLSGKTALAQTQQELISNPGFEQGISSWVLSGNFAIGALSYPHSGSYYAYITGNNQIGTMYQQFSIPSNATAVTLSYYYNITSEETQNSPFDVLNITLQNTSGQYLATVGIYDNRNKGTAGSYVYATYNLINYTGQTIRLNFLGTTNATNSTTFRIDDVHAVATIPSVTVPASPTNLVVVGTTGRVLMSWTDNSNNETGFKIERKVGSSGSFSYYTSTGANQNAYQDTLVSNGTVYYYRVYAYNSYGNSPNYTNEANGMPLAIPVLTSPSDGATVSSSSVNLQWNIVAGATCYGVDMGSSSGSTDILDNVLATTNSYTKTGLAAGTYYWRVRAANTTNPGVSDPSGWRSFTILYQETVTLTLYVHEGSVSGPLLSGVLVTGSDGAGVPFNKTTDGGYVVITGAPSGSSWAFAASKSGYVATSWSQSITTTCERHAYLQKAGVTLTAITAPDSTASEVGGDTGTFRVSRDGDISSNLTVYFTISGSADNGIDYDTISSPVTIPAGQFYKDITVTPIDDSLIEENEYVILTLSSGIGYDIGYPNSARVVIIDNEKPSVTVNAIDAIASEPGTDTGTFRISRTGSTNSYLDVLFNISGTAINWFDYNLITSPKTIQKGQQYVDITVTPKDDTIVEGDATVILTLLCTYEYNTGSPDSATVIIQDNDFGLRVISPNRGEVWEKGKTYEIKWASSGNPGTRVRITLWKGDSLYIKIVSDTENDGSFLWTISSSIPTASDYRVRITSLSNQSIYDFSDNYFTITTNAGLSSKIVSKREFISKLENVYQVNYLEGLITFPLINKYDEDQAKNLMNQWESQIPNSQDSQRSLSLERGILAEKGIDYTFHRDANEDPNNTSEIKGALVMAEDTIGPFCEIISLVVPLDNLRKGVNQYVNSNPDLPKPIKDLMVGVTRVTYNFVLDAASAALNTANAIKPFPFYNDLKSSIDFVKDFVLRGLGINAGMDVLLYVEEPIGVYGLTKFMYIPKTQPYLNNAINNLSGLNYSGELTDAQTKVNQILDTIKNESNARDNAFQITKSAIGLGSTVLDLVSIVGVVSAETVTVVAQIIKGLSLVGYAGEGVANGWYLFVDMPGYVNKISNASFHPDQVSLSKMNYCDYIKKLTYSPQNNMIKIELLSELKESTQSYNNLVQQVITAINNDDLMALETLLPQLLSEDGELGGSFKNSLAPLFGVAANANSSDPDFKANYETTCDSLFLNDTERLHLYGLIVEYLLSTQGKPSRKLEDVKSDIQNQGSITTNAVNYAEQKINEVFDQTSSVQSAPVVAIIYNNVQVSYECNNKYDVTATIKNVGAGQAQEVTVTLDLNPEEDFYFLTDKTVTIGNLEEVEERMVVWQFGIYTTSSKSKLVAFTFSTDTTNGLGTQLAKGSEVTNSATGVLNTFWSLY